MVLQLVGHNSKMLTELLEEKSQELNSALTNLTQVSHAAQEADQDRQELLRKLHAQEEDNLHSQQEISGLILSLERERSQWEVQVQRTAEGMSMLSERVGEEA
jgi:ABC-type transporter Mla subunit MlaD